MPDTAQAEPQAQSFVDAWKHARVVEVPTADGNEPMLYEIPDLDAYIAYGEVPDPLFAMACKVEQGISVEFEEALASAEDRKSYRDLRCHIIATHLRRPNLVEEFGLEEAVRLVDKEMPAGYRDHLWSLSVHIVNPIKEVTTLFERLRFPDGPARGDAGADRGEVREAAE